VFIAPATVPVPSVVTLFSHLHTLLFQLLPSEVQSDGLAKASINKIVRDPNMSTLTALLEQAEVTLLHNRETIQAAETAQQFFELSKLYKVRSEDASKEEKGYATLRQVTSELQMRIRFASIGPLPCPKEELLDKQLQVWDKLFFKGTVLAGGNIPTYYITHLLLRMEREHSQH
jgi:hypothetical protein